MAATEQLRVPSRPLDLPASMSRPVAYATVRSQGHLVRVPLALAPAGRRNTLMVAASLDADTLRLATAALPPAPKSLYITYPEVPNAE